jgi:hypothetical protein
MELGEKLFEETGKVTGFRITKVNPYEGTTMEITFVSEIKGAGKVPNGTNMGSGRTTQYPTGTVDSSYEGIFTSDQGDQFMWWAHEKSKMVEGGKTKGIVIVSGFTSSQRLSWMNKVIFAIDSENDPSTQQFRGIAYRVK